MMSQRSSFCAIVVSTEIENLFLVCFIYAHNKRRFRKQNWENSVYYQIRCAVVELVAQYIRQHGNVMLKVS